jgi:hypothetical protein
MTIICEWGLENSMFVSSEKLHYVIILSSYTMGIGKCCRNHYFIYKIQNSGEETVCRARRIITHQTQFFSYGGRSKEGCNRLGDLQWTQPSLRRLQATPLLQPSLGRSTNICCVQSKHIRFQPSLFTVIPFDTWQFGKICVWVNFIIQKLKSKHLVCLSFFWWQVFLREREKIFYTYSSLGHDNSIYFEQVNKIFLFQSLTPNTTLIQLWCARSKLNMDEICSLNIHLWYIDIPQKVLLKSLNAH